MAIQTHEIGIYIHVHLKFIEIHRTEYHTLIKRVFQVLTEVDERELVTALRVERKARQLRERKPYFGTGVGVQVLHHTDYTCVVEVAVRWLTIVILAQSLSRRCRRHQEGRQASELLVLVA